MKVFVRVVLILALVLLAFFTFYQFLVGNPFHEGVHPAYVTLLFAVMAAVGVFVSFRGK